MGCRRTPRTVRARPSAPGRRDPRSRQSCARRHEERPKPMKANPGCCSLGPTSCGNRNFPTSRTAHARRGRGVGGIASGAQVGMEASLRAAEGRCGASCSRGASVGANYRAYDNLSRPGIGLGIRAASAARGDERGIGRSRYSRRSAATRSFTCLRRTSARNRVPLMASCDEELRRASG